MAQLKASSNERNEMRRSEKTGKKNRVLQGIKNCTSFPLLYYLNSIAGRRQECYGRENLKYKTTCKTTLL